MAAGNVLHLKAAWASAEINSADVKFMSCFTLKGNGIKGVRQSIPTAGRKLMEKNVSLSVSVYNNSGRRQFASAARHPEPEIISIKCFWFRVFCWGDRWTLEAAVDSQSDRRVFHRCCTSKWTKKGLRIYIFLLKCPNIHNICLNMVRLQPFGAW